MRKIFQRISQMWEILKIDLYEANLSERLETQDQYWRIEMYGLGYNAKVFLH